MALDDSSVARFPHLSPADPLKEAGHLTGEIPAGIAGDDISIVRTWGIIAIEVVPAMSYVCADGFLVIPVEDNT